MIIEQGLQIQERICTLMRHTKALGTESQADGMGRMVGRLGIEIILITVFQKPIPMFTTIRFISDEGQKTRKDRMNLYSQISTIVHEATMKGART